MPLKQIIEEIDQVLLGKDRQIRLALTCLIARGHLLIEDMPGMGKTTLAHCLAAALGLKYNRVQFTSDLLPADILGVSVFSREREAFDFHPGPVFTQLLLADEINRTTPKTQSALLEAMEEGQVTVEGETRPLPEPFFVIATQNPVSQSGTYALPESQLDRFLMRISLGYPGVAAERKLYQGGDTRAALKAVRPVISLQQLRGIQERVNEIVTSEPLLDYFQSLVQITREHPRFAYGLSPRGALAWLRAAKAWALIHERDFVVPEDVQAVMPSVVGHRIVPADRQHSEADLQAFMLKNADALT